MHVCMHACVHVCTYRHVAYLAIERVEPQVGDCDAMAGGDEVGPLHENVLTEAHARLVQLASVEGSACEDGRGV